ncbi:Threonyl/alanyl tRNA synthetase [Aspergillus spectabilis]
MIMRPAISVFVLLKSSLRPLGLRLCLRPTSVRAPRLRVTPPIPTTASTTTKLYTNYHLQRYSQSKMTTKTTPLYQKDESLRTHTTTLQKLYRVSSLSEANKPLFKTPDESKDWIIVTAETIFYAQGGGQPADTGIITLSSSAEDGVVFNVASVRNGEGGEILHLGAFSPSPSLESEADAPFKAGDSVFQRIDAEKRVLNSRIHTAGHIIGLSVRHLTLTTPATIPPVTELKAQHYPDLAFVDFQGSIEGKFKDAIQAQVDKYIAQKLPVKVYFWNEEELKEKCAVVPGAVAIPEGELVRAVDIEGAGAYPCGGTHVEDTGRVGRVVVKKISRSKGNSKVSYTVS